MALPGRHQMSGLLSVTNRQYCRALLQSVIAVLALAVVPVPAPAQDSALTTAQLAQRAAVAAPSFEPFDAGELFDRVVSTLHKKYFDPDQIAHEQWIERANATRASVVAAPTPAEAVQRINALLAELRASHLHLHTPDDLPIISCLIYHRVRPERRS